MRTTARFWIPGDIPPAVASYLRSVLVRTVEAQKHDEVWVLLSMLYGLDTAAPAEFSDVRTRASSDPSLAVRHYTDWARRQARTAEQAELSVVSPDAARVATWLRDRVRQQSEFNPIYTDDLETLLVLAQAADIAIASAYARKQRSKQLQLPVVLLGESGTGKELLARAMHRIHMRTLDGSGGARTPSSQTLDASFGPINCGGLPAKLVESELFGHTQGSFTGADEAREGIIPRCARGTVFLDEIGDTPPEVQLRLLRFLNDGEVRPVGSDKPHYHFPWVIAATHRDLAAFVAEGKFREDLLNRLHGYVLTLKPLKFRGDDVLGALDACVARHSDRDLALNISVPAERALREHPWPGNLRAVDHFARRLVQERLPINLAQEHHSAKIVISLDISDLPLEIQTSYMATRPYADILAGQYAEEVRTLSEQERVAMRDSLLRHYHSVVGTVIPEVRFVRSVAKLARSEVALRMLEDANEHRKLVQAVDALAARIAHHHEARFRNLLCMIDGIAPPSEAPETELVEQLPAWLRKTLALIEGIAGNPDVAAPLKNLEAWFDKLPAPLRAVVMDLLARVAEEVRNGDVEDEEDSVIDVHSPADLHWKELKMNKAAFEERLNKAGSIAAMARELHLDPKTVSAAADRLGVARPSSRKTSGKSPGASPREQADETSGKR